MGKISEIRNGLKTMPKLFSDTKAEANVLVAIVTVVVAAYKVPF
jgi:hypothetical protein